MTAVKVACRRGGRLLFKDFDLDLEAGAIAWLRGRNGQGKTSLLRLAAGLSAPDSGQWLWGGVPLRRAPAYLGQLVYVGHSNAVKDDLSVAENLQFLLSVHGRPSGAALLDAAIERVGLGGRGRALVRTLSQGQRRRVALSRLAADGGASVWILDEPFDALDADGVDRLNGLLVEHAARGGRVLLTSHLALDSRRLRPTEIDLDRFA